ncbi:predicted protein [Coccidioides posadasii str. Silveira]|uniref:Predicted protein n=1 Tax=Coccidioides posadasii (strain RMSCC 757 / Silveira) TaxID=443226 RepID=E9D5R7_COCPS|nr:predicted protein [Coccidioides posadasii str. Silveira]
MWGSRTTCWPILHDLSSSRQKARTMQNSVLTSLGDGESIDIIDLKNTVDIILASRGLDLRDGGASYPADRCWGSV